MLEKVDLPPQQPPPRRLAPIIWTMVIVGLVVALVAVPSFRNNVISIWDVSRAFFRKLFGF